MNIVRLVGGSVATALFAVVLERQIVANLGSAAPKFGGSAGVIGATYEAAAPRRRPGRRGVRPHVLVVGRRHPHRLHPDPLPAQPCRRRRRQATSPPPTRRGDRGRGHDRIDADGTRADHRLLLAERLRAAGLRGRVRRGARELVEAAGGDADRLETLTQRRLGGEPLAWITGWAAFGDVTVAVDPGVYVPRWQSLELARRAAARLPDRGTGGRPVHRVGRDRGGTPGGPSRGACRRLRHRPARRCLRAERTAWRSMRATSSPRSRPGSGTPPTWSWPWSPTYPPPSSGTCRGTPSNSRTRRTTTVARTGPTWWSASSPPPPGTCAPGGGPAARDRGNPGRRSCAPSSTSWDTTGSRRGATRTATCAASRHVGSPA